MMIFRLLVAVLATALVSPVVKSQASGGTIHEPRTPWYDGIGRHSRTITAANDGAQGYFNQGLAFLMAANPEEAIRSFEEAARFDPQCAMAYWGIAVANGPLLGQPRPSDARSVAAVAAINRAHELASRTSPLEQRLIASLTRRYADPPPEDRQTLDLAYAAALRELWQAYPSEPDIGAMFAGAMLLSQRDPWWDARGELQGPAAAAARVLEVVLRQDERHPLANRLNALVWLGGKYPENADAAADRLRDLAPGLGHYSHLAARVDARRGRWTQAIETSLKALAADARYLELSRRPPDRYLLTMARHRLLLIHAATMSGRASLALEQARLLAGGVSPEWLQTYALEADGLTAVPLQVLVRFGKWDEVLAEPEPPGALPMARALRHAARGLAYAEKGAAPEARNELQQFMEAVRDVPPDANAAGQPARVVARIAAHVLAGWIELTEGEPLTAVAALEEAVRVEDTLGCAGAALAPVSARHALGGALLRAHDLEAAEAVYRADLERLQENGWALFGLIRCLHGQEKLDQAAALETRLAEVWKAVDGPEKSGWFDQPAVAGKALAARE